MPAWDPQGAGNTHIDVVLTNISVGFPNEGAVGNVLFPMVGVTKQSNKYYIFGRESFSVGIQSDARAPGAVASEIPGMAVSTDNYWAQEHALQIPITDEERDTTDSPFSPDRDGTELVTARILLAREIAMKNMVTTTANYGSGYSVTLAGTTQWSDYVNSVPISDWKTGRDKIHSGLFLLPTIGVIPYQVMSKLEDHPDFLERIKYVQVGMVTRDIIASLFTIPQIVVPGMGQNTANPGQTAALGYLWGKDVLMAYVPARPGLKIPAFAYEFNFGYNGGTPMIAERWREEPRKSDLVRVSRRYDLKFVALDASSKAIAGYVLKAAVA